MKLYLGRSREFDYELSLTNSFSKYEGFDDGFTEFCKKDFEKITGIKLKIGEVREIESIDIKLKEDKP